MQGLIHYFKDISQGIKSSLGGLWLTFIHLWNAKTKTSQVTLASENYFQDKGIVTLEYPYEAIPVPDNGRYRLHNEIEDCIVCDKCAKICPVNCIDIVSIKSSEEIGVTSDGSSKRLYAATFNIDMAKCCYCGLCTTVCPTECLTMTQTFDFSEIDVTNLTYYYSDLTPQEAEEKRKLYEQKQLEKASAKITKPFVDVPYLEATTDVQVKPAFKPKFPVSKPASTGIQEKGESLSETPKPAFKPKMPAAKQKIETEEIINKENLEDPSGVTNESKVSTEIVRNTIPSPKPIFKPKIPGVNPKIEEISTSKDQGVNISEETNRNNSSQESQEEIIPTNPKPIFRPKIPGIKPKVEDTDKAIDPSPTQGELKNQNTTSESENTSEPPKSVFKPKIKPIIPQKPSDPKPPIE